MTNYTKHQNKIPIPFLKSLATAIFGVWEYPIFFTMGNYFWRRVYKSYSKFTFKIILIGFVFLLPNSFPLAESKSQSEIRVTKKLQVAGFKFGNKYNSVLFSYNLNESFTFGIDIRRTNSEHGYSWTNYSDYSKVKINDAYFFLQWFPFKVGGLFLSARLGYYKLSLESQNWYLISDAYSDFVYNFYSLNISKPMYGAGIGYRWVFENGISLGIEAVAFKQYHVSLKQYEFWIDTSKQITLADYYLNTLNPANYIAKPTSVFFSIGYSF